MALVPADDSSAVHELFPLVRFNRNVYKVPRDAFQVRIKSSLAVTEDEWRSLFPKGAASRSPDVWRKFIKLTNIGLVKGTEGTYPVISIDLAFHASIKAYVHPIPFDVASKIFPGLYSEALERPDAYGLELVGELEEPANRKVRVRLEAFKWSVGDCGVPDGAKSPAIISPIDNGWGQLERARVPPWVAFKNENGTGANGKAGGAGKRTLEQLELFDSGTKLLVNEGGALPVGLAVNADEFARKHQRVAYTARLPIAEGCSHTCIERDGAVHVVVSMPPEQADDAVDGESVQDA
jgi:hypothetical protein